LLVDLWCPCLDFIDLLLDYPETALDEEILESRQLVLNLVIEVRVELEEQLDDALANPLLGDIDRDLP